MSSRKPGISKGFREESRMLKTRQGLNPIIFKERAAGPLLDFV